MPSVGRKFLLAGKGGLNLTHGEPLDAFVGRYGARRGGAGAAAARLRRRGAARLGAGLGVATFVGSSGRVFPTDMKAAPLLRAWLHRLRGAGRALPHAPPLAGLGRTTARCASTRRRATLARARRGHRAGAGRRAAGRGWAPTAPGCRWLAGARRRRWRRCGRRTAASTSGWSEHFAQPLSPAQPMKSVAHRPSTALAAGRASSSSPPAASRAAWSMPRRRALRDAHRARRPGDRSSSTCCPARSLEWVQRRSWRTRAGRARCRRT